MDRTRIDLDPSLPPVAISGRVLNEICAHARETQPEECCGLIMGNGIERFRSVHRCRNEMTLQHKKDPESYPRDGRKAFYMNELDYMKAQKQAEEEGEQPSAIYHSHVGAGAYFSEMDQQFAEDVLFPFPGVAHIVIGIWERQVTEVGIFESEENGAGFVGRQLEVRRI
jgi:proteasome lid subunit RPN8/RPN11